MMRLNPIINRDLEVRSRGFLLPAILAAVNGVLFLVGLLGVFGAVSGMRQTGLADYSALLRVYRIVVLTEYCLILLVAPLYTASAISGERETGTFDLLMTTRLTPVNIIAEKMISAFISVAVIIISCLPAMLIPLLYGGVEVQSAVGLLLLFLPEALLMLSVGMLASSLSYSVVKSTVLSYAIVLGMTVLPVLLAALARPFMQAGGNRAAGLLAADPLLPVFAVVMKQTGEAGAVRELFTLLGWQADRAFTEHLVLICLLIHLAAAFVFLMVSVSAITPGRSSAGRRRHGY